MILGREEHVFSACFTELNDAVEAIEREAGTNRHIVFNAHEFTAPPGSIVYNLENVPGQVPDPATLWAGHEVWDFDEANAARYGAKLVPIGYHPSMERFARAPEQDIDVIFTGCINERRAKVLDALAGRGLNVVLVLPASPYSYGPVRDGLLSRAKLAISMLHRDDYAFASLRVSHLVANHVPVLVEACRGAWDFVTSCPYDSLVDAAVDLVYAPAASRASRAKVSYDAFKKHPMVLP